MRLSVEVQIGKLAEENITQTSRAFQRQYHVMTALSESTLTPEADTKRKRKTQWLEKT
jgi:hypothetical protein